MDKVNISKIDNGYIVEYSRYYELKPSTKYFKDMTGIIRFLAEERLIQNHLEKRVYIIEAPGYNHDNFTDTHAQLLYQDK